MRVPGTSGSPQDPQLISDVFRLTSNGTITHLPPSGFDGFDQVTTIVNVPTPTPNLQQGSANITTNGTSTFYPSTGYDGFSSFTVTTNVSPSDIDFDAFNFYRYSEDYPQDSGLLTTITPNNVSWSYASANTSFALTPNTALIYIRYGYYTFSDKSIARIGFYMGYGFSSYGVSVPEGSYYATRSYTISVPTGTSVFAAAAHGDDLRYSISTGSNPSATLYTDDEDLDLFYGN